jgi:glycosyltransferase involved in cell wall biosynthesis
MSDNNRRPLALTVRLISDTGWMGGVLYTRNLVRSLAGLPDAIRPLIRLLGPETVLSSFRGEHPEVTSRVECVAMPDGLYGRIRNRLGWLPRKNGAANVFYPATHAVRGAAVIRWIPDFQHRYLPHLFTPKELAQRDRWMQGIASTPGVVVLSSETAAADFRMFFPEHRATARVWRFHSFLDGLEQEVDAGLLQRYGIPEKYLYLPNQFWTHKNHITVFRALARLKREHGIAIPLVCTGNQSDYRNASHFEGLLRFLRDEGLIDQVHLLGLLPRRDQVGVLRSAAAVVQPSLFEGWSTVVEDVRAVGRPLYLSDIPVHREQAPRGAAYFSAESEDELAALLMATWPGLAPGPDREAERRAQHEVQGLLSGAAKKFCVIAQEASRLHTGQGKESMEVRQ